MVDLAKGYEAPKKRGYLAGFTWMDSVFLLTVGVLLVWSLSIAVVGGTELVFAPMVTLFRAFIVMFILRTIFLNKFTLIFTAAVVFVTFIIIAFNALLFTPPEYATEAAAAASTAPTDPIFTRITEFISLVIGYVTGFEMYTPAFDTAIQWFIVIGLSIFVFIFGFLWFNFFAMLGITMLTFGLVLNSGFFFYSLSFYVFIFCIIAYLIKFLNLRSMGERRKSSPFVLYAMPFTAICLAVAIALPTPAYGTAQHFTENFITRPFTALNDSIQAAIRPKYFSLAQTGFGMGSHRRLGGNVTANYDTVMRINHPGPIYLTGSIFDEYTGFSWTNNFTDEYYALDFNLVEQNTELFELLTSPLTMWIYEGFFDTFKELNEVINYAGSLDALEPDRIMQIAEFNRNYDEIINANLYQGTLLVEHEYRAFTVFTTGAVSNIIPPEYGMEFYRDRNGAVLADRLMQRGARYIINYADLPENFNRVEILSLSRPGILSDVYFRMMQAAEYDFNLASLTFNHSGMYIQYDELLRNHLIPRADWIHSNFTTLPEHFPARIGELARQVVDAAGAETPLEMAIVLENYLRASGAFGYTLTPGSTPIDRDFVDYFLFDLRVGYCTFFASAFVTMMRSLDIPTRYVEGFIVTGDADYFGYLSVINRQGHAWAEVYFEGFGWQRFDPTPAAAIFTWNTANDTPVFGQAWYEFEDEFGFGYDWDEMFIDIENMHFDFTAPMAQPTMDETGLNVNLASLIGNAFLIVAILLAALIILRIVFIIIKDASPARKNNSEAVVDYFHRILRYMRYFNFEINEYETASQFADRISKRIGFENDQIFMGDLARIFSRARYSYNDITLEERKIFENAIKTIDRRLQNYFGIFKYFLYKYIMAVL